MQWETSKLQLNEENSSSLLKNDSAENSDIEKKDVNKGKKLIMVGSSFQANIQVLCDYDDAPPYENEDKLLWNPEPLLENTIEDFLKRISQNINPNQIKDNEQALFVLLQCGYNAEEAHRRLELNKVPLNNMPLWSEKECSNFEDGIRTYGKNFYSIQKNKVRTRAVGELVQFYYLWKKSERHDMFAGKNRLKKKKYMIRPGVTDLMDKILEDEENKHSRRSSSSSSVRSYYLRSSLSDENN